jgi:diadenosine tetraphosphate (Ap4A) HIT family hydrolase
MHTEYDEQLAAERPCWFCGDNRGEENQPVGGWIYEDEHWKAGCTPRAGEYGPRGLVILESRRHFLDAGEMTSAEAATFGPAMQRLTAAVHAVTGADRVYTWASMRAYPHMHTWLLPWWASVPIAGTEYLDKAHTYACTPEEASETADALRKTLAATA